MTMIQFNLDMTGRSLSLSQFPLAQNPVGYVSILLKQRFQRQYQKPEDGQPILLHDYTIVPEQQFPVIQIPVTSSFNCSFNLLHALRALGIDRRLRDFLHQHVGETCIVLSRGGLTGFQLLATIEVVEIETVEYREEIEKWMKKERSRIMIEKLERRQRRRVLDVNNQVKLGDWCSVCLEELKKEERNTERKVGNLIMMPCSHIFHRPCISRWLEEQNSCPMCRRETQAVDLVN